MYLIKVSNDFVEQPEALLASLIDISLIIEVPEIRDGGKHHTDVVMLLCI